MKIEHVAIWTQDLEKMRRFYEVFFDMCSNEKYHNASKNFSSYFLSMPSGARIELMHDPEISTILKTRHLGLAHIAISVGSKEAVDQLTERIRHHGHRVVGNPRTTGDGYYESVVQDIEDNLIEITI